MYCQPGKKYYDFLTKRCKKCGICKDGTYTAKNTDLKIDNNHGAEKCYDCVPCPATKYSNSKTINGRDKYCESTINCTFSNRKFNELPSKTQKGKCGDCYSCMYPYSDALSDSNCLSCTSVDMHRRECISCSNTSLISTIDIISTTPSSSIDSKECIKCFSTTSKAVTQTSDGLSSINPLTTTVLLSLFVFSVVVVVVLLIKRYRKNNEESSNFSSIQSKVSFMKPDSSNKLNIALAEQPETVIIGVEETSHFLKTDRLDQAISSFDALSDEKKFEHVNRINLMFVPKRVKGISRKEFFKLLIPNRTDLCEDYDTDTEEGRYEFFCQWIKSTNPSNKDLVDALECAYKKYQDNIYLEILQTMIDILKHQN